MNLSRKRPLVLWGLLLLALLFTGCSSGDGADTGGRDFVFTGGGTADGGTPGPGAVTFNFVKAQAPLTVPTDTTQIRFKFYTAGSVLIQTELRDFAASITINPVDARAASVEITAIGANGFPLATATAPLQVQSGETVEVDFNGISVTPVTLESILLSPPSATLAVAATQQFSANFKFSNGDILPGAGVTWSATGQVSVDGNGLATGTTDGEGTVIAEFNGIQGSAAIVVGQGFFLDDVLISPGGSPVVATNGGTLEFSVEGLDQFGNPFPITGTVNWAVTTNNSGGTIDQTGLFTGGATEATDTITVTVDGTFTDTQDVIVTDIPGDITMIELNPDPVNLTAFNQTAAITATGTFEDMTTGILTNAQHGITYSIDNSTVATINPTTGVVTAKAQGSATVTVSTMSGGMMVMDDVVVNVDFGAANQAPVITPDAGTLNVDLTAVPAYPGITVTDDQISLGGGTVTLSVSGTANDLVFDVVDTGNAVIEPTTLMNNGTSTVTFDIAADVTPAQLSTFLQGVTVARNMTTELSGDATMQISVADGHPTNEATGNGSRSALAVISVGAMSDYTDIATALANVNNQGATILVEAGHTEANLIDIDGINNTNHNNLTLLGAAQDQSAGVTPDGARIDPGSLTGGLSIDAFGVTVNGLDFDGGGGALVTIMSSDTAIANCAFTGPGMADVGLTSEQTMGTLIVANCLFTNWNTGVRLVGVPGLEHSSTGIGGCAFTGNDLSGLESFYVAAGSLFTANGFAANGGVHLYSEANTGVTVTASANEFKFDGGIVEADVNGALNAQQNFWNNGINPPDASQFLATPPATIDVSNHLTVDPFPSF